MRNQVKVKFREKKDYRSISYLAMAHGRIKWKRGKEKKKCIKTFMKCCIGVFMNCCKN